MYLKHVCLLQAKLVPVKRRPLSRDNSLVGAVPISSRPCDHKRIDAEVELWQTTTLSYVSLLKSEVILKLVLLILSPDVRPEA